MVSDDPESFADLDGHYELNGSGCGSDAKCQKKWDKASEKFEARRQKNLLSKKARVRAAAAAYGAPGEANGVHLGFANLGPNIHGSVDASGSLGSQKLIQVTLNFDRAGNSETITHEGTHVADDARFLDSYNFLTRGYNQNLNISHGQTEFNAYQAGAEVTHEHGFGPNETQKIWDFISANPAYHDIMHNPIFDPHNFPLGIVPPAFTPQMVPDNE